MSEGSKHPDWHRSAIHECQQLFACAMHCGDHGDADGFASCFADEGVFLRGESAIVGHDALRAYIAARPPGARVRHIASPPHVLVVNEASARSRTVCVVYRQESAAEAIVSVLADILDEYQYLAQGWRITRRTASLSFG